MPTFTSAAVTVGTTATAAQYNSLRTDLVNQTGSVPGTKTAKTNNTVYQATTSGGILVVIMTQSGFTGVGATVYSDSSNPPTTVVWIEYIASNTASDGTITVPIAPDMYYKFVATIGTAAGNFYDH